MYSDYLSAPGITPNLPRQSGAGWELRLGRWQDALADVQEVDACIVDAPYSERTHSGHDKGSSPSGRASLPYEAWNELDVEHFVASWAPRTRGWMVSITDHVLAPAWESAMRRAGRLVFAPLPFVAPGSRVRLQGDGPSCWATWIVVARPRTKEWSCWGTLPGGYVLPRGEPRQSEVTGGKPLWLMRALVCDYSRPGGLVCDPCAGAASTLVAAVTENRRAIGSELMVEHYAIGAARMLRGHTPNLFEGRLHDV